MGAQNHIASMLADMVLDTSHRSPWHSLAHATAGLTAADLGFKPIRGLGWDWGERDPWPAPCIMTVRQALMHVAGAAEEYANHLGPRTRAKAEAEWCAFSWDRPLKTPESVVGPTDAALRVMSARAAKLTDADLPTRSGMWGKANAPRLLLLIDGAVLHTAWHLGQVALLIGLREAAAKGKMVKPATSASRRPAYPGRRDWSDCQVASRTEACLRLLEASHRESPWHALRLVCKALSQAEAEWLPFPEVLPFVSIAHRVMHVADCKCVYADHAFGDRKLQWRDCQHITGWAHGKRISARGLIRGLDLAHEYLVEHVARATDRDLRRRNPMHHGVPLTGWQVVACMAQHDAWHGGQVSILRDMYAALAP
ncbi:MAG: DinB family protein [Armatimonadetes bacterium]|nr:DinB family protein [Armatimonadota bacterium]